MGLFSSLKDRVVEPLARRKINEQLDGIGELTRFELDSSRHSLTVELLLKGESTPIMVRVLNYELSTEEGRTFIRVGSVEASREWLTVAARRFLSGKRFPVPAAVAMAL
ncbi:MAG TPA: hypothetical protein VMS21_04845 [Methylomirabilota bacterium]|nr:hypothetical protein [Methylomirabilota bacterium]